MSDDIDLSDIDWTKISEEELKALDLAFTTMLEHGEAILTDERLLDNPDHPDFIQARDNLLATTGAFVDSVRAERKRREREEV